MNADQAFALLADPRQYAQWSAFIDQVEPLGERFQATTMMGTIPFSWNPDPICRHLAISFEIMGTQLGARLSIDPAADGSQLTADFDNIEQLGDQATVAPMLQALLQQDLANFAQWAQNADQQG